MSDAAKWNWPRWSYLVLALMTAPVAFVHYRALDAALEKTRWGNLLPGDVLIVRNTGDFMAIVSGALLLAFMLSARVKVLREITTVAFAAIVTCILLGWYAFCCSTELLIQVGGKLGGN